jgi:hypothetical protein
MGAKAMIGVRITLPEERIKFSDERGIARYMKRRQRGSVHTNNRNVSEAKAIEEEKLGMRTECAGHIYLPMTVWHNEILDDPTQVADLEHPSLKIDVKGIPYHLRSLISPVGAVKLDWAYLLISAEDHPTYWLCGWCMGDVLASAPVEPLQPKRPCHVIKQGSSLLREPSELLELLGGSTKRPPLIPPRPKYNPTLQPPPKPVAPPRAKFQLRGVKVSSEARCPVCYQVGGKFERVTYTDAPLGGLPVHTDCIQDFFAYMIDGQGGLI